MTELIDRALVREQFEAVGPDLAAALADAVRDDFARWSTALAAATETRDEAAAGRARHALRGLCHNFGARALERLAGAPLDGQIPRDAMLACAGATVTAILEIVGEAGQH